MDNQEISFKDEVDQLARKIQSINEQVMKFNLRLENHQSNYKKNSEIAKLKFGTDDFDKLVKIAEELAAENDRKKAETKKQILEKEKELNEKIQLESEITKSVQ